MSCGFSSRLNRSSGRYCHRAKVFFTRCGDNRWRPWDEWFSYTFTGRHHTTPHNGHLRHSTLPDLWAHQYLAVVWVCECVCSSSKGSVSFWLVVSLPGSVYKCYNFVSLWVCTGLLVELFSKQVQCVWSWNCDPHSKYLYNSAFWTSQRQRAD